MRRRARRTRSRCRTRRTSTLCARCGTTNRRGGSGIQSAITKWIAAVTQQTGLQHRNILALGETVGSAVVVIGDHGGNAAAFGEDVAGIVEVGWMDGAGGVGGGDFPGDLRAGGVAAAAC